MSTEPDNSESALPTPSLVVDGVSLSRGGRVLLTGLALALEPGELVWLRAPNGHGKTTLLRALVGLGAIDAGTVAWKEDADVHYVAHANALKGDLTVAEALAEYARLRGLAVDAAAIDAALARFGLSARARAPTRTLSQGQRRRVALARLALTAGASTWILDEPWDALDADGSALVDTLLVEHAVAGGVALFTSHVPPSIAPERLRVVRLDG